MAFHVIVHSNASNAQFKNNTAAEFKTKLNKEIILDQEYDVAIVGITRYVDNALPAGTHMRIKRGVLMDYTMAIPAEEHFIAKQRVNTVMAEIESQLEVFPSKNWNINMTLEILNNTGITTVSHTAPLFPNEKPVTQAEFNARRPTISFGNANAAVALMFSQLAAEGTLTVRNLRVTEEIGPTFRPDMPPSKYNHEDDETLYIGELATTSTAAPTKTTVAPTKTTVAPAKTTVAPAKTTVAPTTAAPIEDEYLRVTIYFSLIQASDLKIDEKYVVYFKKTDPGARIKLRSDNQSMQWDWVKNRVDFFVSLERPVTYSSSMYYIVVGRDKKKTASEYLMAHKDLPYIPGQEGKVIPFGETNRLYYLKPYLAEIFKLPEYHVANGDHTIVIDAPNVPTITYNVNSQESLENIAINLNALSDANIPEPYVLSAALTGQANLKISWSSKVKVYIPYVLNYFTLATDKLSEQWTCKIFKVNDNGAGQLAKTFKINYKEKISDQIQELHKGLKANLDKPIASTFETTVGKDGYIEKIVLDPNYYVEINQELANMLDMPVQIWGGEYSPTRRRETAWVCCDIVDDMIVGEKALKLLNPAPLPLITHIVQIPLYVPVKQNRFSVIEIKLLSDFDPPTIFRISNQIMFALHFKPRYKRKRSFEQMNKK